MNNKNLPTMFIDTVSTKIDNQNTQVYYDSRYKTSNSKWTASKPKSVIEKKLDGILNLVSKGNIINVYLELTDTYIEGILKERKDDSIILSIYNKEEEINISNILDVIILNN
jgi:hypothetical protein